MAQQFDLDLLDSFEFEERADYIPEDLLVSWSPQNKHFESIQRKLTQVGAKLLIGPRGAGKTHYMRHAFVTCKDNESMPLPLYVSFNHYLRLETYLHEASNAIDIFHSWVLAKIVLACYNDYEISSEYECLQRKYIEKFISDIEKQQYSDEHNPIILTLSIEVTQKIIESCISKNNRKRAVLFMDDAALTLTKEYMVEFFDVFRSIKTSRISPKASVYPGTTQYGPRFHLGQDAEPVFIWQDVEQNEYSEFMKSLLQERFSQGIDIDQDINSLLIFASFGIPRAYINLIRAYQESKSKSKQSKFNSIIEDRCKYLNDEYRSIIDKLPQYENYIETGWLLFTKIVEEIKAINHTSLRKEGNEYKKIVTIGIDDLTTDKMERIVSFLIEAGLLYETTSISHGPDRKLRRFIPHYAYLFSNKAFTLSKGFNAAQISAIVRSASDKHPLRKKISTLLHKDIMDAITLKLPNCSHCGTRRLSDTQKFCHECGTQLIDESSFRICMRKKLVELPLTAFQKSVINETPFVTVEDVLSSKNTAAEFMKVKRVAQKRADLINSKIQSWVNEFLM
ncbi:zinc ribbon domain-containing protein [Cronobacter turicensis]|uniref:zinc ribbon domain-containing protein n=1 Tax=Cronobacter malonaticus TaxID=413503 RepID=UPI001A18F936|nr:zinc ribbon domain-containing protein [Cronobacter malonaticus]ELY5817286.1 zinc ribbon domain-containing protein [Cronobacter turicensis]MDI6459382.1 zinc ribbon domain-containing protein [Cronobacter malonaticus]HAU5429404.1 zinc ribbon domain-containing protein [Cronobacter malonaticus]